MVLALAGVGLGLAYPSGLRAQVADSSAAHLTGLIYGLSPSTRVRLSTAGERWTGRLASRQPDSLTLATERRTRTVALDAIDTLWLRQEEHDALLAAAGFGALMFALLQLSDNGGDRGSAARIGGVLFLGATTGGLVLDAIAEHWARRYPE